MRPTLPAFLPLLLAAVLPAAHAQIRRVDIVHLSHMDIGFTDHPAVTREMQKKYLDMALQAAEADPAFAWTAESMLPVSEWWESAPAARRSALVAMIGAGRIAVGALPFNNTPFLDGGQWARMLHWVPEDLWQRLRPSVAVQNDVNGIPRAGALQLLDRGVHRLLMGLNNDSGGSPLPRPTAFWWHMPDGRRLFVYLGDSYPAGYSYFHQGDWRRGPVPRVAETAYRMPRSGDFFRADEASLRQAHQILQGRLRRLESNGYRHSTLVIPFSNQWRMDNDPPFPPLATFVSAWNRLGLEPRLRLVTAAAALEQMESEVGGSIPEYSGEWTDWWANGAASSPRAVAASRIAKRALAALESGVWGAADPRIAAMAVDLEKELCLFDEHTWGSSNSVALPDSLDSVGQWNEKARLAFRPMALAEWLVSERARSRAEGLEPGLWVFNPTPFPYTGWVALPNPALRADYSGIDHYEAGLQPWRRPLSPADLSPENDTAVFADAVPKQIVKFWVRGLAPHSHAPLRGTAPETAAPEVRKDERGWPVEVRWPGMSTPLFAAGLGDFLTLKPTGFAPRWVLADMAAGKPGTVEESAGSPGETVFEETGHTLVFTQPFTHPRLKRAKRRLEIWKGEARARLTVVIYRVSSDDPESMYISFSLPVGTALPRLSSGGVPFVPYQDQLPGVCRDYFAIDGWAHYTTPAGEWLWVSRDAPLVTFGKPEIWKRRSTPADTGRILSNVFNNFWYTNFTGNEHGALEFQYDLLWRSAIGDPGGMARTMAADLLVVQR